MIGEEFISRKPVSLIEIKKLLKARKKDKELSYEQGQTYKYVSAFSKLTEKQHKKLFGELVQLETISDGTAMKILNIMPKEIEIIRLIPEKSDGVSEEDLAKALEAVGKYVK